MSGGLKKDAGDGRYVVTGTLAGVDGPGRRVVEQLEVRGLSSADRDALGVLHRFPDLRVLELRACAGLDLNALAGLPLEGLALFGVRGVDLAVLSDLPQLRRLFLVDADVQTVPAITLPETLEVVILDIDDARARAESIAEFAVAIDWSRHRVLEALTLRVGTDHPDSPIRVDLGFLSELTGLERLEIPEGVLHSGPAPSPLEPPFPGLPTGLRHVRIDADDPETVRAALLDRMGVAADDPRGPSVRPRRAREPRRPPWEVRAPDGPGDGWRAYGRLPRGDDPEEPEYDALARARRTIREADPGLLRRLAFDPENAGTGIEAPTREDLVRALEVLGLPASGPGGD